MFITDIFPPWWDFVMVGMCWQAIITNIWIIITIIKIIVVSLLINSWNNLSKQLSSLVKGWVEGCVARKKRLTISTASRDKSVFMYEHAHGNVHIFVHTSDKGEE